MMLVLAMVVGMSSSAFAAEIQRAQMEGEIQAAEEEIYAEVYRQLDAQDGLHMMDTYKSILGPKIRASIVEKYGITYETMTLQDHTYSAPKGAVITYIQNGSLVEVTETYYDKEGTLQLVDDTTRTVDMLFCISLALKIPMEIVEDYFGLKHVGISVKALMRMIIAVNMIPYDAIKNCGYYAYTIGTYDPVENNEFTVTLPWTNYDTIHISTGGLGIRNLVVDITQ